jgi:hypothetical protein
LATRTVGEYIKPPNILDPGKSEINHDAHSKAVAILLLTAILEAGGDALMRAALHSNLARQPALLFMLAALVLFAYGWTVNAPPWDFGKLIGIYAVFLFLAAQLISRFVFKQAPSMMIVVGGMLIVVGGVVKSLPTT